MKCRMTESEPANINTALVLAGGGAKGAYQVGVIKQLLKFGIKFDLVTGSSIGAFNGVLLAEFINSGLDSNSVGTKMKEAWLQNDHFLSLNWGGFLYNLFKPLDIPSIFSNSYIKKILLEYIPVDRKFSDYTRCQLSVTGTNLNRRELINFDYNSLTPVIKAVLASMAYPVGFPAVEIEGDFYIDGGALSNVPLKEAILWGAQNIYVIFLNPLSLIRGEFDREEEDENTSGFPAVEVIEEFIELASNNLMYGDLKRAKKINKLIKLLNRYENKLPVRFREDLRKLFGLKYGDGKRVIHIKRVAPKQVLDPPGLLGFNDKGAIKETIQKGEEDASQIFIQ